MTFYRCLACQQALVLGLGTASYYTIESHFWKSCRHRSCYHILTSSVIYCRTDAQQREIHLFYNKEAVLLMMTSSVRLSLNIS